MNNIESTLSNGVLDFKDIIVENISFGKQQPYQINYDLIPIYYENSKTSTSQPLIIKTPRLFIPHTIFNRNTTTTTTTTNGYLDIIFLNEKCDTSVQLFKKWIKRIETRVLKIISRRKTLSKTLENKEFSSIIKDDDYYKSSKMYLTIQPDKNECIDTENNIIPKWAFQAPCYGFFIIQIKNVWINANKWGINLYTQGAMILHSQIVDPPQMKIQYMFSEELELYKPIGDHPDYSKYFKMLKMGVPLDAVKQKIISMNLNPDIINYSTETFIINIPELSKCANPRNNIDTLNETEKIKNNVSIEPLIKKPNMLGDFLKSNLLKELASGGITLKKVNSSNTHILQKPLLLKNVRKDLLVPSLDEIRNALKNLKKKDTL